MIHHLFQDKTFFGTLINILKKQFTEMFKNVHVQNKFQKS